MAELGEGEIWVPLPRLWWWWQVDFSISMLNVLALNLPLRHPTHHCCSAFPPNRGVSLVQALVM